LQYSTDFDGEQVRKSANFYEKVMRTGLRAGSRKNIIIVIKYYYDWLLAGNLLKRFNKLSE